MVVWVVCDPGPSCLASDLTHFPLSIDAASMNRCRGPDWTVPDYLYCLELEAYEIAHPTPWHRRLGRGPEMEALPNVALRPALTTGFISA